MSVIFASSELPSWLEHGSGKLRYDDEHDGLLANRAFLEYQGRFTPTLFGHAVLNVNGDGSDYLDVTEAYLEWRPLPRNAWRIRSRVGAFYPRLSMENTDPGWSSPYSLSSSAINTWIGEELRTIGAELRISRALKSHPQHRFALEGAAFMANDPTGSMLTWRGWSAHDRQTGLVQDVPLPSISAIAPWAPGGGPTTDFQPFQEIDHRAGFYAAAEWQWTQRIKLRYSYYDNHADPEAQSGDTYAWETWFSHAGVQVALPWDTGLISQWINGSTRMGDDLGPWRVQDLTFDSAFVLLTRPFGRHRVTARYERFDLQPVNDPEGITNKDDGTAVSVSWLYELGERWRLGAEYLWIESEHCVSDQCFWVFNGQPRTTRESQLQISLRWQFSGPGRR